uniref:Uncharacterized protein n=1 Tax=Tanacetum cinerariifolium TaxID=118510 RepID=A0A699I9H5_TANCI|nr:hypothetical protein [Tanacetum cinerariifolium]
MAQHMIPTAQLVPRYKQIGRCNNYAVLQSIPCSPECRIVGLILLDHCLSHALTATVDVPANLFVAPANIHIIEAFMNRVGYQGVVDKVQEMLEQEEIDKLADGNEDEESYASAFADSVINNDDVYTGSKLEPESHKEHPEHVSDDDETKRKDEEVEKEKEVVEIAKETNVDDISAKKNNEVVTEKEVVDMNDLSSDKKISEELADTVTPTNATSSKTPSTTTRQKKSFTLKTRCLPGSIAEMPRLVKLAVNKDREVFSVDIFGMVSKEFAAHGPKLIKELFRKHMQNTTLNLYPKTNSSAATTSSADLQQQQLYLSMKTKPHDQAADPEI